MSNTHWSKEQKLTLAGLILAVMAIVVTVTVPEIRTLVGLDKQAAVSRDSSFAENKGDTGQKNNNRSISFDKLKGILILLFSKENLDLFVEYVRKHSALIVLIGLLLLLLNAAPDLIKKYEEWRNREHNEWWRREQYMRRISERTKYREKNIPNEPYRVKLGRRHRILRKRYLKLNPREMANFYGFELVSQLERYESGEEEFTVAMLKKLGSFFFINEKFFEEGSSYIFKQFEIYSDEARKLIADGFRLYFICCPQCSQPDHTYPLLHKTENGYGRTIVGDLVSSFVSDGGGKTNILYLIKAMILNGKEWPEVHIINLDLETWYSLENQTFYSNDMIADTPFGSANQENLKIFRRWFEEVKLDGWP